MMNTAIPSIFDVQSLATLKQGVQKDDPQALKAAAKQFEAVFLQMMLKSMRAATPQDGLLDSDQTRFYQELLDAQLAQVMAAKGGTGLAAIIERQLSRPSQGASGEVSPEGMYLNPSPPAYPLKQPQGKPLSDTRSEGLPANWGPPTSVSGGGVSLGGSGDSQTAAFSNAMWPHAEMASRQTGIPPQFILAQAALESGWGRHEPKRADGQPSHNLFGIKAGSNWDGPVAEATTSEYVNGQMVRRVERFRAYASYAEAFDDYARLLRSQPRYVQVLGTRDPASFARSLQSAGYATDPAYADKLTRIIGGLFPNTALRG